MGNNITCTIYGRTKKKVFLNIAEGMPRKSVENDQKQMGVKETGGK